MLGAVIAEDNKHTEVFLVAKFRLTGSSTLHPKP